MIRFHNVSKVYPGGVLALQDITLSIDKAELVFLTGPSGAGKTTLLNLILGLERPTQGQIFISGINVGKLREASIPFYRRNIGILFQDFKLIPNRTALENVASALEILGFSRHDILKRSKAVLFAMGLERKLNQFPNALSGGEQQRVALARAMVRNPSILLADEPTGNLDVDSSLEIVEQFRKINIRGVTVLIATHDANLIQAMPTRRVIQLFQGRTLSCP